MGTRAYHAIRMAADEINHDFSSPDTLASRGINISVLARTEWIDSNGYVQIGEKIAIHQALDPQVTCEDGSRPVAIIGCMQDDVSMVRVPGREKACA